MESESEHVRIGTRQVRLIPLRAALAESVAGLSLGCVIGGGGQRVVFSAQLDGVHCALKVSHEEMRQRTEREVALARTFDHASLVPVLVDELWDLEVEGEHFVAFVEEHVEGRTLSSPTVPQDPRFVLELCEDVWSALDYLAGRSVVHRDVSPKNIMLRGDAERPRFVLLDVGIARHLDMVSITLTSMAGPGTATYAAPEQFDPIRSKEVDWRTDLFALGVVAYECLTGQFPYGGPIEHGSWLKVGGVPDDAPIDDCWSEFLASLLHRRKYGRPRRENMPGLLSKLREGVECS